MSFVHVRARSIMIVADTPSTGASVSALLRGERAPLPLLVAAASLALSLAMPFVLPFNSLPVTTFYQEWVAMGLGCVTFIAIAWSTRGETLAVPRSIVLPAGLCLLLLIQALSEKLACWQVGVLGAVYLVWPIAMLCSGAALARGLGADRFCLLPASADLRTRISWDCSGCSSVPRTTRHGAFRSRGRGLW